MQKLLSACRTVGRILSGGGGEGVLLKVRWTMDLLHNKTCMTEFVRHVLALNNFNLRNCAFRPSF